MNNWVKISSEELEKSKEIIGLKKGDLQILLVKALVKIDKVKEYCKSKIKEQKELPDYSKYYMESYDKAINLTNSTHSGVMLETIKSTTIKRYEDILEILGDKE